MATLLGVLLGAILTSRSQSSSWTRDCRLDACAGVVRESVRLHIALRREFKDGEPKTDWSPWNEALTMINLVGQDELVTLADRMDQAIWAVSRYLKSDSKDRSDHQWTRLRDELEETRLAFLNCARRSIAKEASAVTRLVARPRPVELAPSQPEESDRSLRIDQQQITENEA
jgi:hypothetical protein